MMNTSSWGLLNAVTLMVTLGVMICFANAEPKSRKLKVLVNSPTFGWSHNQFQGRLADVLIEAGHEVHLLMFEMIPFIGNYTGTHYGQKVIRIERVPEKKYDILKLSLFSDSFDGHRNMLLDGLFHQYNEFISGACEELLMHDDLLVKLRAEKYDVGISELMDNCMFGVFHAVGIEKTMASYSMTLNSMVAETFGIPSVSSYVTSEFVI